MDIKFPMSIKITAGPAVFECGDGYAVVWSTNAKGSGKVIVEQNGKEKIFWDARGGSIKTHENVHVVKLAKEELDGYSYKVSSQRIIFKNGYSAIKGNTVVSKKLTFKPSPTKDNNLNILCISDVHDRSREMYQSIEFFSEKPDLIMLIGDISSEMEYKKRYIEGILVHAGRISGGEIPVVYARGNHETRGEFASQMINYFPHSTDEFYFTFNLGELSAIVLDPGEDKEDDHPEYSGLVDFASYREKEYSWLCSLKNEDFPRKYLIAFSHDPLISKHFGKDWNEPLKKLGVNLIVGGHHHISDFIDAQPPIYIECGKRKNTDEFAAGMLTIGNNRLEMKTISNKGEILLDKTIEL